MKKSTLQQFFEVLSSNLMFCFLSKKNITTINSLQFKCRTQDYRDALIKITRVSLFSLVFLSGFSNAIAQNFPDPKRCTSGDLQLVEARLTGGDACNRCEPNTTVTRTLTLSINNTTGSNRTSFAFWGTLERYEGTELKSTDKISGCNSTPLPGNTSALPPNTITSLDFGDVTYECGQRLKITNLYLAWTAATDNAACPLEPSKIAPKCGVLPFININAGVNADLTALSATCTAGGSITVTPFGGTPNYSVTLGAITRTVIAGDSTTFEGLAAGDYNVTITDSTLPTACSVTKSKTVGGATPIGKPAASIEQPTCSTATGTVNVSSPVSGVTYTLKQSGVIKYTAVNGVFTGVVSGTYQFAASIGICSTAGDDIIVNAQPATPSSPSLKIIQPSLCGPATGSIEVCNPILGYIYKLNGANPGITAVANVPVIFTNLAAGSNPSVSATSTANCTSAPASCSSATTACSAPALAKTIDAIEPKETVKINQTEKVGFDAYPVPFRDQLTIKYNFDYESDVKIEVFNSQGIRVFSKTDTNGYLNKETALDLKMNKGKEQMYVVKITTNRGSTTKKVMSSR